MLQYFSVILILILITIPLSLQLKETLHPRIILERYSDKDFIVFTGETLHPTSYKMLDNAGVNTTKACNTGTEKSFGVTKEDKNIKNDTEQLKPNSSSTSSADKPPSVTVTTDKKPADIYNTDTKKVKIRRDEGDEYIYNDEYYEELNTFDFETVCPDTVMVINLAVEELRTQDAYCETIVEWHGLD